MKLMFFLDNKLYDRKESSLAKYYRIRSKLAVFKKFITFTLNVKLLILMQYCLK